ncbi:MAG: C45 family peptidase [Bacteroidales bacterium]|nr:C45 family peptidase [Bacteroidales bacterium]
MAKKRKRKILLYILAILVLAIIAFVIYFNIVVRIDPPTETDPHEMGYTRSQIDTAFYSCETSWLNLNEYGLWELYIEGNSFELGIINGLLSNELIQVQEDAFVNQIRVMIPSESYLNFLRYFIAWFNKDLDTYIKNEYLLEIYGVSAFASENYGFIGPKYHRILNYHAAHDIGHALQNMNLVECTAFGVWDERSVDSTLLIGRNFDFYVGDAFAKNKIIAFVNPDKGYKFASVTWAGMIGVVSGMNEKGLTVTLNSAKSEMPFGARTPVSIIAREILQYASNIEEAMAIASKRRSFVSESFLIGSAEDHKAVVIEKSTDQTLLYDPDTNFIILTNHFQSDYFNDDELNIENLANKTSSYRHKRVKELLDLHPVIDYHTAAGILRDRRGKRNKDIGLANEKAINQLIAHHSVIFIPEERLFWISTAPYQLGSYLCYNLDTVFAEMSERKTKTSIYEMQMNISADTFLFSAEYAHFLHYKELLIVFQDAIKNGDKIDSEELTVREFISANPEYFHVYSILGQYYQELENFSEAIKYYNLALSKEVSSTNEYNTIRKRMEECMKDQ